MPAVALVMHGARNRRIFRKTGLFAAARSRKISGMGPLSSKHHDSEEISSLARYREIRAAGQACSSRILKHPATKSFDLLKAARKLGIELAEDRTLVFDAETEMDVLTDFFLHEYRQGDQTPLQACRFTPGELTPLETALHEAHLQAYTSLFEVLHAPEREGQVLLRDRLNATATELWLTDVGLSQSFRHLGPAFIFTRIVSVQDLHMTGGFGLIFGLQHESALIDGYRRAIWTAPASVQSARRMRFFFELNRKIGLEFAIRDVPPVPGA